MWKLNTKILIETFKSLVNHKMCQNKNPFICVYAVWQMSMSYAALKNSRVKLTSFT